MERLPINKGIYSANYHPTSPPVHTICPENIG